MFEPYFALAEELDIPAGIHMGEGPPGAAYLWAPKYRARLTSPFLLEEVLVRHPRLRVYVMHYGSPLVDEMIAMLFSHPQLYVDVAWNDWGLPRKQFHDHLRRLIEGAMASGILFGSDAMVWPGAIDVAIQSIETAPFLTVEQKRDILLQQRRPVPAPEGPGGPVTAWRYWLERFSQSQWGCWPRSSGLDRDRAFYPTVAMVVASYYCLFAVIGASPRALVLESLVAAVFLAWPYSVSGRRSGLS
jgi:hypothetical protein